MSLFQNGRPFRLAIRCCPPGMKTVPLVEVEMAARSDDFVMIAGKVDTGASRTMLTFETARRLGIEDPRDSSERAGTACTATGETFPYYMHVVSVRIAEGSAEERDRAADAAIEFPLKAAFAEKVKRDLFGVDWLAHLCLAIDRQAIHFLAD